MRVIISRNDEFFTVNYDKATLLVHFMYTEQNSVMKEASQTWTSITMLLKHLPFTSKVTGSIFSKGYLM